MRPDRPVVVAHRIERSRPARQRAQAPAREHVVLDQASRGHASLVAAQESGPQRVARIRRDRLDLSFFRVKPHRPEGPAILTHRETLDKELAHVFGARTWRTLLFRFAQSRIEVSHFPIRGVRIGLHFGQSDRWFRERPVTVTRRVGRILPALIAHTFGRAALVLDESVAIRVAVGGHPLQRGLGVGQQLAGQIEVTRPAHVLAERHEEERCRIDAAVIGAVGHALQSGELADADLVQDLARLFVAEVVDLLALVLR